MCITIKETSFNSIQTKVYQNTNKVYQVDKFLLEVGVEWIRHNPSLLAQMLLKTCCQENSETKESLTLLIKHAFTTKEWTNGQQPC